MTPYLLAVGLWTLAWVGGAWWLRRRVDRRFVRELQRFLNDSSAGWGPDDDLVA
jgi:hypothetical protein